MKDDIHCQYISYVYFHIFKDSIERLLPLVPHFCIVCKTGPLGLFRPFADSMYLTCFFFQYFQVSVMIWNTGMMLCLHFIWMINPDYLDRCPTAHLECFIMIQYHIFVQTLFCANQYYVVFDITVLSDENTFENVVCRNVAILFWPQCVNHSK